MYVRMYAYVWMCVFVCVCVRVRMCACVCAHAVVHVIVSACTGVVSCHYSMRLISHIQITYAMCANE